MTFRIIPSDPTRVAALLSGDVDAIENIPTPDFAKLKTNTAYQTSTKTSHRIIYLSRRSFRDASPFVFDKSGKPLDKNPLKDLRVRQAISKAIDRNAIKDRVMEGLAVPSGQPRFRARCSATTPALKPDAYDLNAAKKLLADAGYPNGFAMTIHGPNNRYVNDDQIMQTVAQMLTRAGIQTKVETMPMSVVPRARAQARVQLRDAGLGRLHGGGVVAAARPPRDLHPREGLGRVRVGPLRQPAGQRSPRQGARARSTTRAARSRSQEAVGIAMTELGIIPIHHQINTWATRKGVTYTPRIDEYTLAFQFKPAF